MQVQQDKEKPLTSADIQRMVNKAVGPLKTRIEGANATIMHLSATIATQSQEIADQSRRLEQTVNARLEQQQNAEREARVKAQISSAFIPITAELRDKIVTG